MLQPAVNITSEVPRNTPLTCGLACGYIKKLIHEGPILCVTSQADTPLV